MIEDLHRAVTLFFGSIPTDLYAAAVIVFGTPTVIGGIVYYLWTWGDK